MYVPVLVRAQYFAPTPSISAPFAKKHVKTRLNHKIVRNLHAPRLAPPYLCQKNQMKFTTQDTSSTAAPSPPVPPPMTQSPASAAQAATHFRFIRAISVLHCYTQSCLCTVAANSPPPPPGWQLSLCHRCPGMSPTPRSAQYPVSHGCHHLPGWRITSPLVIIVALGHRLRRRRSGDRSAAPIDIYHATRRAEVRSAGGDPFPFYPCNPWC